MDNFLLSQILVGLAFVFNALSFQFLQRKAILACFILATVFLAWHFFLLSNVSAAALILVATARYTAAYFSSAKLWLWFFVILNFIVFFITYSTTVSILALVGSVIATFASFQSQDRALRKLMLLGCIAWIAHNIIINSPAAVALEVFFLISNLIGYWRYYIRQSNLS